MPGQVPTALNNEEVIATEGHLVKDQVESSSFVVRSNWNSFQHRAGELFVAKQIARGFELEPDQVLLEMVACSICGTEHRFVQGDKAARSDRADCLQLGHEGVGRAVAVGGRVDGVEAGDIVVIDPHVHDPHSGCAHEDEMVNPICIGNGNTSHMSWECDGVFGDFVVVPAANAIRVPQETLAKVKDYRLRDLPSEALFTLTEPLMCVLCAAERVQDASRTLKREELEPGRALVIGAGPAGTLHAIVLSDRGWDVSLHDSLPERISMAVACLGGRARALDTRAASNEFDLVVVAASSP